MKSFYNGTKKRSYKIALKIMKAQVSPTQKKKKRKLKSSIRSDMSSKRYNYSTYDI